MTRVEFITWFGEHCARFSATSRALDALPADKRHTLIEAWFYALEPCDLADAREASLLIFSGQEKLPEFTGLDSHARTIREIAKRLERDRRPYVPPYNPRSEFMRCKVCQDAGHVLVFHPATVKAAIADRDRFALIGACYSAVMPCTCKRGDEFARGMQGKAEEGPGRFVEGNFPRYNDLPVVAEGELTDPRKLLGSVSAVFDASKRCGEFVPEVVKARRRLLAWLDENNTPTKRAQRCANYEPALEF